MRGLPQGGKWHRFPPLPRRRQVLWPTTAVRFFSGRASPPREQRGGRLQVPSRHCAGAGGWRSPGRLGKQALPEARAEPPGARRPLPLLPPTPLPWRGLEKDAGSPSEVPRIGIWEGMARGRGFPSSLRQVWLRESFSKFPAASAQVASAGRGGDGGGERASLAAAASTELWARLLGAARVPGGQALLPGAKAAADAGGSEGGSRPPLLLGPSRGAYTWGSHGSPGRAPRGRSSGGALGLSEPRAPPRFLPGSFLLAQAPPDCGLRVGGPRAAMPPGRSRNFQPFLKPSPPQQPGGKGRAHWTTRPL